MALAVTSIASGNAGSGTSVTTASVSPNVGDLIVIFFVATSNALTPTGSGLNATWTYKLGDGRASNFAIYCLTATANGTGTITITWGSNQQYVYEVLRVTGTAPVVCQFSGNGAATAATPSTTQLAIAPLYIAGTATTPVPTGYGWVGGWGILVGLAPTFTGDASGGWTVGTLRTQGVFLCLNVQWKMSADNDPSGTWTWASGTANAVGAIGVVVADVSPSLLHETLTPEFLTQYTIGRGGFSPPRLLHTDPLLDQQLGANVLNASGGPATSGAGRDDTLGNPGTPALKIRGRGIIGPFYFPARAGVRTLSAKVYYTPDDGASYRPQLIIAANSSVGVQSDQISTAPAGANQWLDFPALTVTLPVAGVLLVYLKTTNSRIDGGSDVGSGSPPVFANFDHLTVT